MTTSIVPVPYRGGTVDIEWAWLRPERRAAPLLVFLHEGLGSVSMWRALHPTALLWFPLFERAVARGAVVLRPTLVRRPEHGCLGPGLFAAGLWPVHAPAAG